MIKILDIPIKLPKHNLPSNIVKHCNVYKEAAVKHASLFAWLSLAKYVDVSKVKFNENGKPYLIGNKKYISLSHSFNKVAIAIDTKPIGIDIDVPLPLPMVRMMAQRVLNEKQRKQYFAAKDQGLWFAKYWTQHEAYLKMIGGKFTFNSLKENVKGIVSTKIIKDKNNRIYVVSIIKK